MSSYAARLTRMASVFALPQLAGAKPTGITMAQARALALRAAPGQVEKAEREREGGGKYQAANTRD